MNRIEDLVREFVVHLAAVVAEEAREQARALVERALGGHSLNPKPVEAARSRRTLLERPSGRRAPLATAKLARARKVQGQYLGALKRLRGAERARVKKIAAEKGVAAAVVFANKLRR